MRQMESAKKQYDSIPIPEELYIRVQQSIDEMSSERAGKGTVISMDLHRMTQNNGKRLLPRKMQKGVWAAAASMAVFVTALNTSPAFAAEMGKIPVIGTVARVLTFRSYEEVNEDMSIAVEIPSVEIISQDTNGLTDSVNEMIYAFCEQYAQEAKARAEAYKEAFLATGGTQEEWEAHKIQIRVSYEIKSQTAEYLSFAVTGTENWNSGAAEKRFYNIDLSQERIVTLEDVLGSDYRQIADAAVREQMEQMTAAGVIFWSQEEGGFTGIEENPAFYMNEDGNPVLVFEKYMIAPGSYGEIEFEITK